MYCFCCGSLKTGKICPICGTDEKDRAIPQTAAGKALRELFDIDGIGLGQTIGDTHKFELSMTDYLPGEQYTYLRRQINSIASEYMVRRLMMEQMNAKRLPDDMLFADLCKNALETGYTTDICQRVISILYEMIGWKLPIRIPADARPQQKQAGMPQRQFPLRGSAPAKPASVPAQHAATSSFEPHIELRPGESVIFGRYPQSAKGTDSTPIEWIVLNVQGNKALLLSKFGLDAKPYNSNCTDSTWKMCTLRLWLHNIFLNKAFTPQERTGILLSKVDNCRQQGYQQGCYVDCGDNTEDKIFLLSYAEANRYLGVNNAESNSKSGVIPTAYAKKMGACTGYSIMTSAGISVGWWLRTPGYIQTNAAIVGSDGFVYGCPVDNTAKAVRPALWVLLSALSPQTDMTSAQPKSDSKPQPTQAGESRQQIPPSQSSYPAKPATASQHSAPASNIPGRILAILEKSDELQKNIKKYSEQMQELSEKLTQRHKKIYDNQNYITIADFVKMMVDDYEKDPKLFESFSFLLNGTEIRIIDFASLRGEALYKAVLAHCVDVIKKTHKD